MATARMDVTSFVGKLLEQDDVDVLREGIGVLAQAVMEAEVSGQIGAGPYERSSERTAYRNGYRNRRWDRGPPVLGGLPGPVGEARPKRRAPGDLRCPRGPAASDRQGPVGRLLAAVPGALHAQPALGGPEAGP